jgi:hypothetical protein
MNAARKLILFTAFALIMSGASAAQINMKIYSGMGGGSAGGTRINYQVTPYTGNVPVLTGAPFSGVQEAERHRVLMDGTHVDQVAHPMKMWRNSAGDTRVEIPMFSYETPATRGFPELVAIFNVADSCEYILDPEKHVAHRFPVKIVVTPKPAATPVNDANRVNSNHLDNIHETVKTEELGTNVVEGLIAQGRRTTITKDPGIENGNELAEFVVEKWDSVDLQVEVLYKTDAVHSTDSMRKLTNVNRAEPDAALFHLPPGYTIVDETALFHVIMNKN